MPVTKSSTPPPSPALATIERLTAIYAEKRAALAEKVKSLNSDIHDMTRRRLPAVRAAALSASDARTELREAIEQHKDAFEKPRTRTFHGIKVGFRKLVGKLTWTDSDRVVALIERHFPEQKELLVKTTQTPVKAALEQLPAVDLKKLGCTVGDDTDEVVITPDDSDVDKLVDALLKGASDEAGVEVAKERK